jgi:hypothetical protein
MRGSWLENGWTRARAQRIMAGSWLDQGCTISGCLDPGWIVIQHGWIKAGQWLWTDMIGLLVDHERSWLTHV